MYMHFNLALTQALRELPPELREIKFVNWIHDATIWNPDYAEESKNSFYPWDGLRKSLEGYRTVVISDLRKQQVRDMLGLEDAEITMVPNGIDVKRFLSLEEFAYNVFLKENLAFKDMVFFTPTRILGRKNLELGIELVKALRGADKTVKWLISGAPDPHNKATILYYEKLESMIKKYDLENDIVFLSGKYDRRLSDEDITSLYRLTDILLFPSRQEGFGLPVIEAGLSKALAVISDIPPLADLGQKDAIYLKLQGEDMDKKAADIISYLGSSMSHRLFKRALRFYPWDVIFKEKIEPLLSGDRGQEDI
jgi:glycosyltransferase involved in cell wall biosynthesis